MLARFYTTLEEPRRSASRVLRVLQSSKLIAQTQVKAASPTVTPPTAPKAPSTSRKAGSPVQMTITQQLINNIMSDGRKQVAQNIANDALLYVQKRTNRAPVGLLETCVEKISPFVKNRSSRQGARSLIIPTPLSEKQRKKIGIKWLIDQVTKSKTAVTPFGTALGQELIKIMNGTSAVLQKAVAVHKQALQNRSNVRMKDRVMYKGRRTR